MRVEVKNMKKIICISLVLVFILIPVMGMQAIAQPVAEVTISPTILHVGNTTWVNGTQFQPNVSVRIDIVFPSGVEVKGVVNTITDNEGNFSTSFVTPDVDGNGYIRVVSGDTFVSTLVTFKGTKVYELRVTMPSEVVVGQYADFRMEESMLKHDYHILKIKTVSPTDSITTTYAVLVEGKARVPMVFYVTGMHDVEVTIEGTGYVWRGTVEVMRSGSVVDDDSLPTNITWNIVKAADTYTINLIKSSEGYITSGIITVLTPEATTRDIAIVNGFAQLRVSTKGTYTLQYREADRLFMNTIDYTPAALISLTGFSNIGDISITYTIDGKTPEENVEVIITSGIIQDTVMLINGVGTFSTQDVGTYSFSVAYRGVSTSASASYSDTYKVTEFSAVQSDNYEYIYIIGKVEGVNSGIGRGNARVDIKIDALGYSGTVRTSDSGTFRATIPLTRSDKGGFGGGALVMVSYEYGDSTGDTALVLKRDMLSDWWLLWGFCIFMIGWVAKEKGWIYKYCKVLPPHNAKKNTNESEFDDPFGGGVGGFYDD